MTHIVAEVTDRDEAISAQGFRTHLWAQNNVPTMSCTQYCARKEVVVFIRSPRAFADFVRSHRVRSGMTKEDLGTRTGMSRRWVQELESGKLVPSLEATLSVATAFGYELHLEPMQSASHLDALFDELT